MKIVESMKNDGLIEEMSRFPSLKKHQIPSGFKFIILTPVLSAEMELKPIEQIMFLVYSWIKKISLSKVADYGLELTSVEEELIPIKIASKSV